MKRSARLVFLLVLPMLLQSFFLGTESANAQVEVSASVPSKPTHFSANLSVSPDVSETGQNHTLTYRLAYSTTLSYTSPLVITASWSQGQLNLSQIDILRYVVGSATDAYGETPPVVDTLNRTITWNVPAFPANTTKSVEFQLQTQDVYQGTDHVSFSIQGNVSDGTNSGADDSITQEYVYKTAVSGGTPTPTITPTPKPQKLQLTTVTIQTLSKDEATIHVAANQPSLFSLSYGTSPRSLTTTLTSLSSQSDESFSLSGLTPGTTYYFVVTARGSGTQIRSDIFLLKTPKESSHPSLLPDGLRVTSSNFSLSFPSTNGSPPIILPPQTVYTIQFAVDQQESIVEGTLLVENQRVLGASTFFPDAQASTNQSPLLQTSSNAFTGKLLTSEPGFYKVSASLHDKNGSITKIDLFPLRISPPFRVLDLAGNGIEGARVLLRIRYPGSNRYVVISPQSLPIANPGTTDEKGYLNVVLPAGTYKAEVTAPNFYRRVVDFALGEGVHDEYPTVKLSPAPFNLFSLGAFYGAILIERFSLFYAGISLSLSSPRFNLTVSLVSIILFTAVLLKLFARKHLLPIALLPVHLFHVAKRLRPEAVLRGVVVNADTNSPLSRVSVQLLDHKNRVLSHMFTTRDGTYSFPISKNGRYKVRIEHKGFHTVPSVLYDSTTNDSPLLIGLVPDTTTAEIKGIVQHLAANVFTYGFEALLFGSFMMEILCLVSFSVWQVLPFFLISLLTLIIYALSKRHI